MSDNALAQLDVDARTVKRAQWEAMSFRLLGSGEVEVRNESYHEDEVADHTYSVEVEDGVPVRCGCPADQHRDGACKHRVAVAIREPVREAASVGQPQGSASEDATPSAGRSASRSASRSAATDGGQPVGAASRSVLHSVALDHTGAGGSELLAFEEFQTVVGEATDALQRTVEEVPA